MITSVRHDRHLGLEEAIRGHTAESPNTCHSTRIMSCYAHRPDSARGVRPPPMTVSRRYDAALTTDRARRQHLIMRTGRDSPDSRPLPAPYQRPTSGPRRQFPAETRSETLFGMPSVCPLRSTPSAAWDTSPDTSDVPSAQATSAQTTVHQPPLRQPPVRTPSPVPWPGTGAEGGPAPTGSDRRGRVRGA
jgi:hypothetical protein